MVSLKTHANVNFQSDLIIDRFSSYLTEHIKDSLEEVVLFGSRARGDYREDSDYDFTILINSNNKNQIRDIILDAEVLILDEFNKMATSLIYTLEEWEIKKKYPIGKHILLDGIVIWKKDEK
jgi:predicted nucleotidyltransferase